MTDRWASFDRRQGDARKKRQERNEQEVEGLSDQGFVGRWPQTHVHDAGTDLAFGPDSRLDNDENDYDQSAIVSTDESDAGPELYQDTSSTSSTRVVPVDSTTFSPALTGWSRSSTSSSFVSSSNPAPTGWSHSSTSSSFVSSSNPAPAGWSHPSTSSSFVSTSNTDARK